MFEKIPRTQYPPAEKPLMVWDGQCGFCAYWTARWQKFTGDKIEYQPYQTVAENIPDIEVIHFKRASRLIETDGKVYSGPRSAYRTLTYGSKWAFLDRWYNNNRLFRKFSDKAYNWIAKHRSLVFKITKAMFGSNPHQPRPFWAIYLAIVVYIIYFLV